MSATHADGARCALTEDALPARVEQWRDVMRQAVRRDCPQPGVTVADYPNGAALRARLEALIAAEGECCAFLRFQLDEDGDVLRLTLHHPPGFSLLPPG